MSIHMKHLTPCPRTGPWGREGRGGGHITTGTSNTIPMGTTPSHTPYPWRPYHHIHHTHGDHTITHTIPMETTPSHTPYPWKPHHHTHHTHGDHTITHTIPTDTTPSHTPYPCRSAQTLVPLLASILRPSLEYGFACPANRTMTCGRTYVPHQPVRGCGPLGHGCVQMFLASEQGAVIFSLCTHRISHQFLKL